MTAESKGLVRVSDADQAKLDAATRVIPDSVRRRAMVGVVERSRDRIVAGLTAIADGVADKSRTVAEAAADARVVLTRQVMRCGAAGAACAGLPGWKLLDSQLDDLAVLIEADVGFFRRFMASLEMKRDQRLGMYGGAADEGFFRSFVSSLPSDALIHWRLGIAEHCDGCLRLRSKSPYSKPGHGTNPLPTIPRGGATQCLTNCRCHLTVSRPFETGPFSPIRVEVIGIGALRTDPTSPGARAASGLYQDAVERYAYYRRLEAVDPKGGWDVLAREAKRLIETLARVYGHSVRLSQTDAEIIEPVLMARAMGLRHVTAIDDDLIMLVATIIAMDEIDAGQITAVQEAPPTVTLGERLYRIDAVGRAILFVE